MLGAFWRETQSHTAGRVWTPHHYLSTEMERHLLRQVHCIKQLGSKWCMILQLSGQYCIWYGCVLYGTMTNISSADVQIGFQIVMLTIKDFWLIQMSNISVSYRHKLIFQMPRFKFCSSWKISPVSLQSLLHQDTSRNCWAASVRWRLMLTLCAVHSHLVGCLFFFFLAVN